MTTAAPNALTDKALSIFAFAAYHQFESGQKVSSVIRRDGAGHKADDEGVQELQQRGLATATDQEITFTPDGERLLAAMLDGMRQHGAPNGG